MGNIPPAAAIGKGCLVHCRSHQHLVEEVWPPEEEGRDTVVRRMFHARQCVEKCLKAVLIACGASVQKAHDLLPLFL